MPKAVNRGPFTGSRTQAQSATGNRPAGLWWLWMSLILTLFLAACAGTPESESAPEATPEAEEAAEPEPFVEDPAPVQPAERAPKRYVVKRGDTLWDISTMFLRDPWLWPEIWHINPQIRNPHLIYPGDVITLFYVDGRPHLQIERNEEIYQTTLPVDRLAPSIRYEDLPRAVPYLPADAMRALLGRPAIITEAMYNDAPYILRSSDGRLMTGPGDRIFVRNFEESEAQRYTILRRGSDYRDPDSGRLLGREAIFIGEARFVAAGDPATLVVTRSVQEARQGDRLFPVDQRRLQRDFYPRAPEDDIEGTVIDMMGEGELIGQYDTIVINRGAKHGLQHGHVLDIYQRGEVVRDEERGMLGERVRLPDEHLGLVVVYSVEEEVSYALVMRALREINRGDKVVNPRQRIETPQRREPRP